LIEVDDDDEDDGRLHPLERKTTHDGELEQSHRALPKNLIRPLPYRIAKANGFRYLLSCSWCTPALRMR
jgi:hypothetical protein